MPDTICGEIAFKIQEATISSQRIQEWIIDGVFTFGEWIYWANFQSILYIGDFFKELQYPNKKYEIRTQFTLKTDWCLSLMIRVITIEWTPYIEILLHLSKILNKSILIFSLSLSPLDPIKLHQQHH